MNTLTRTARGLALGAGRRHMSGGKDVKFGVESNDVQDFKKSKQLGAMTNPLQKFAYLFPKNAKPKKSTYLKTNRGLIGLARAMHVVRRNICVAEQYTLEDVAF